MVCVVPSCVCENALRAFVQAATSASVRCILFLFEGAGVDTKTKYAFAALGAFTMGFTNEMIRWVGYSSLLLRNPLTFLRYCCIDRRPSKRIGLGGGGDDGLSSHQCIKHPYETRTDCLRGVIWVVTTV